MKPLFYTIKINKAPNSLRRIRVLILLIILVLNPGLKPETKIVHAAGPCGDFYVALPDDTVETIADLCGTTADDILNVNPEITDPDNLFPGQLIRIPEPTVFLETVLAISPTCGLPGQSLLVVGSGYPENSNVQIILSQQEGDSLIIGSTLSDQFGRIDTSIIMPDSSQPGTTWYVTGQAQVSSARFTGISNKFFIIPTPPNPNSSSTYVVQEEDTLFTIAGKFNRDVENLLEANPQLTETGQLTPGNQVNIPPQESGTPVTTIAPICGPVETTIQVNGRGFPPVNSVNLSTGPYLVSSEPAGTITTSPSRTFQTQLSIPSTARVGENWVVLAETSGFTRVRSTSNIFIVIAPRDPSEPSLYIVNPGDTLNQIAAEYTRTVASILAVNPQIANPNQLEIGDKIIIPGQVETILISPISGPAQTPVRVAGLGFSPFSAISLSFTRDGTIYSTESAIGTDVNGFFNTDVTIPSAAQSGEIWNLVAVRSTSSGDEIFARSNDFTVTNVRPVLQPSLSIWPLDGSPGTEISVVGSNFPSLSQVLYTFGREGETPIITSTIWTEINGTFAIDLSIPGSAAAGEIWYLDAQAVDNQLITATSQLFTVTNP